MNKNDTNSVNDQRQIIKQIADQWKQTMCELPNRGRGEVIAAFSKVLLSEDEPDMLNIAVDDNWYRTFVSDRTLIESISDVIAEKYGVRMQIRFVNSSQEESESLDRTASRSRVVIECELCGGDSFRKENGFFVCEQCGCKYPKEEAKKLIRTRQ